MKINEFIKELNSFVYTKIDSGAIRVYTKREWESCTPAWFLLLDPYNKKVIVDKQWGKLVGMPVDNLRSVLNLIAELERTPIKKRGSEKKYTVQVIKKDNLSYLNFNIYDGFCFSNVRNGDLYMSHFTQSDIDELKQRDDVAIDWNKAVIEEVEDDED